MTVRVRYFAAHAEAAGTPSEMLQVPDGATVDALWEVARARHPALVRSARPAFARNGEYVRAGTRIAEGDEVAFLPPVSGG